MRGLVLEGGGAKGAFHIGAVKALYDYGYTFDGVAGTSIGAINGAMIAQESGYQTCYEMWTTVRPSDITDFDNNMVSNLLNKELTKETVVYWTKQAWKIIKNLGVPTDKIIPFLKRFIDEDKLRASNMDFAIVTYSISDREPLELFLEDIPYGHLHEFIFASAYFPAFRMHRLNGKFFIDGGVYNNLPLDILAKKGYDELFAIRTMSRMPHLKITDKSIKVVYICPSEDLGGTTELDSKNINYNLQLGYFDAMRYIKGYYGVKYYVEKTSFPELSELLSSVSEKKFGLVGDVLSLASDCSREEVEKALEKYFVTCTLGKTTSVKNSFVIFLEEYAKIFEVEKFSVYNIQGFYNTLKNNYKKQKGKSKERKIWFTSQKTKHQRIFQLLIDTEED